MTPYLQFNRHQWAALRDSVPMTLIEEEITRLKGINEDLSLEEVAEIHLPLSRLLNFYISSNLVSPGCSLEQFLGTNGQRIPYIISIAGSVAVGRKSTTARVRASCSLVVGRSIAMSNLITTRRFCIPNSVLKERGLMKKKELLRSPRICIAWWSLSPISNQGYRRQPRRFIPIWIYDVIPNGDKTVIAQHRIFRPWKG